MSRREAIREWERECNHCCRLKARAGEQIMAPLPLSRVQPWLCAFANNSINYAGPFLTIQGRGQARAKRYLCLFMCFATGMVHLEIVFDLSTDAFLNAFYRMASRRGLPGEIISHNGTNCVEPDRELREFVNAPDENDISQRTAEKESALEVQHARRTAFWGSAREFGQKCETCSERNPEEC